MDLSAGTSLALACSPVLHGEAGSAKPAAARGPLRLRDFFRYHGIWAPGVRLFRAMGLRAKAFTIALTFLLPMALLGCHVFSHQAAQTGFAVKERLGLAYAREVLPLLTLLQRERLLAVQVALQAALQAAAPSGAAPGLAEVRDAVAAQGPKLAALEKLHGAELGTARSHAAFVEAGQAAAAARAGGNADAIFAASSAHIQALLDLLGQAAAGANFRLDPDIDSHGLIDAAVMRLPAMVESVSQVHGLGPAGLLTAAAKPPPLWPPMRRTVAQLTLLSRDLLALEASLDKAGAYNPALRDAVSPGPIKAPLRAWQAQVDATVLRVEGAQADAATQAVLDHRASQAIGAMLRLQGQVLDELDALLLARVDAIAFSRNLAAAVLAIGLALALYLFVAFQKVLTGGLKEVAFHIDAMRGGDLTTSPRVWGADEMAHLMGTLVQMQTSLRRIVSQVRGASNRIVDASSDIASGAIDLRARTEQSAAHLEQTASAMEQIAATVRHSEAKLDEAMRLATRNAKTAERGGQIIGEVVSTMQAINHSSSRIGDIIGTIDGIAFQTSILALNAAVEAARAGEQGRGFAVVASEVRALAQRSSAAAREIKTLITGSVEQVEGGMRVVQLAGGTIGEIVGSSQRVRELLAEVVLGAHEQTLGVAQTASAVRDLDTVTQQNATLVQQTTAAAGLLRDRAHGLAGEVAQFRLPAGAQPGVR